MNKINLAIVGLGSAGRSRLKSIEQLDRHFVLAGIVSRRPELATLSFEQVLSDEKIQSVAISTENALHPKLVRQALEANKHVLCDYPLAFDVKTLSELFDLAQIKNRILHVEHIGLLTKAHLEAKAKILTLGKLIHAEYRFQGGWNDKLAHPAFSGPAPFISYSRLMQTTELFGELTLKKMQIENSNKLFSLSLSLQTQGGGLVDFYESRSDGLKRERNLKAQFEKGPFEWSTSVTNENLFTQDLQHFFERIDKGIRPYYNEQNIFLCTQTLNQI